MRDVSLGFTEPYFLDRPLQLGFVVYLRALQFRSGPRSVDSVGHNLIPLYNQLGSQNLLNYTQNSHGFSVSASYPLKRSFARVGITYGYDISATSITQTTAAQNYFQYINFSGVAGPNSLSGIKTSHIVPSYTYNTVNHPDHADRRAAASSLSVDFAGSVLGGNVNTIRPSIDVKYFKQAPWHQKSHPGVPRPGLADHRLRRQGHPAVLAHLHRRRAGYPRIRDLGHHARSPSSPRQRQRQRVERRWQRAHPEGDSATA